MRKIKNGFTLVELLAVIVILAIILVIAVPKVMSIIEDSKKATLETTAKMIANAAEKAKIQNEILGKTDKITCDDVAKMNKVDYESCEIDFDGNTAKVNIAGKNKFAGIYVCEGTKTLATATENSCGPKETPATCFTYEKTTYSIKDKQSCMNYVEGAYIHGSNLDDDEKLNLFCSGLSVDNYNLIENVITLIREEKYTEEELINNNVIEKHDEIVIFGYDESCGTDVVIPKKIEGLDVTAIGTWSFSEKPLTSVQFPNTIKYISSNAFIQNVTGEYFGDGFGQLTGELDLTHLTNLVEIGEYAFFGNNYTSVKLPDSVVNIGFLSFSCNKITDVLLPNNKNLTIGPVAFYYNNLKKVVNKTTNSYNWNEILGLMEIEETCNFVTGTCDTVVITDN